MIEFKKSNSETTKVLVKDKTALFEDSRNKDELNIIIKSASFKIFL